MRKFFSASIEKVARVYLEITVEAHSEEEAQQRLNDFLFANGGEVPLGKMMFDTGDF